MKNKVIWIINQYSSTPKTGIGGRHFYLSKELVKQGFEVYLVNASFSHVLLSPKDNKDTYDLYKYEGVNIVSIKVNKYSNSFSKKRILNWFLFAFRLRGLHSVIHSKPDVILYSSAPLIGYLGAQFLANKLRVPLAFEVRDIWPLSLCEIGGYSKKHPFIRFLQWIEDRAYQQSDIVISNLKNSYKHMIEHGLDKNKFNWIPNGFSLSEVVCNEPLADSVLSLIPKDKFIIGYTGTFGLANSLDTFLLAAEMLKYDESVAFVLVGSGNFKDKLKKMKVEHHLENVYFIDAIPKVQVQSMLSNFDVCYIGLTADPLFKFGVSPNKLFDYMYSGKPIIYAIDSGEYKPVSGVNAGLEITPQDPTALRDSILRLKNKSKSELYDMGARAKQSALEEYEYSNLAKSLSSVLFTR
ncbi:glycosyltransferase family 4 protein [Shewanella algae]|nr:glycosyltransferase family 4 protein [Shewanella algae]